VPESWGLTLGIAVVLGVWLGPTALLVVIPFMVTVQLLRGRISLVALVLPILFSLLGIARGAMDEATEVPAGFGDSTGATVMVTSFPRETWFGASVLVSVSALAGIDGPGEVESFPVLLSVPEGVDVARGDILEVTWTPTPIEVLAPGSARYVRSTGALATAWADEVQEKSEGWEFFHALMRLRGRITDGLLAVLPGDPGALAAGIVTGDDTNLSEVADDAFYATGTTHITAVSGSNVAMVLAIWNLVIPAGRNRRLMAVQLAIIASIWFYALLVGLEPPALRAAIMATLVLVGSRFGRRPDLLTLLALTSAAMALWQPQYVHTLSFWLSIAATAAIISRAPTSGGEGWQAAARDMGAGILLAQVATLPIILTAFGTWSLASIIANVLLAPLMWLAFPLCFALALLVLAAPWLAEFLAVIPLVPLSLCLEIVKALAHALPTIDLGNTGRVAVIGIAGPGLVLGLLAARDVQRWLPLVGRRILAQPGVMALAVLGPAAGLALALLVRAAGG
jgi:ComEC/Rec2-related protein